MLGTNTVYYYYYYTLVRQGHLLAGDNAASCCCVRPVDSGREYFASIHVHACVMVRASASSSHSYPLLPVLGCYY
jgi:hypothetical protein